MQERPTAVAQLVHTFARERCGFAF